MLRAAGCRAPRIHIGVKTYKRIMVADPGDFVEGGPDTRCPECTALLGHLHHWGYDAERCPACGHQLITSLSRSTNLYLLINGIISQKEEVST